MRHCTISMTMDGYGRGVPELNRAANARVVEGTVAVKSTNGLL